MLKQVQAILRRDAALYFRQSGGVAALLSFALCVFVLVPLALKPDRAFLAEISTGIIWITMLLATLLTAEHIFQPDFEDGSLEIILTEAQSFEILILTKLLAHWLCVTLPTALVLPVMGNFLHIETAQMLAHYTVLPFAALALSLFAGFGSAAAGPLRRSGILTTLLTLPFLIPVLIFGVIATTTQAEEFGGHASILILFAIISAAVVLVPVAAASALRAHLE